MIETPQIPDAEDDQNVIHTPSSSAGRHAPFAARHSFGQGSFLSHYSISPSSFVIHDTVSAAHALKVFDTWTSRYEIAKIVVRNLRRNAKYSALMSEYERGAVSKDEFRRAALEFASEYRQPSTDALKEEISVAVDLAGEVLSSEEVALLLDVDPLQLELFPFTCESQLPRAAADRT